MITHGIEVGLDVLAFALGFFLVVGPVLLMGYFLWDRLPEMRLQWRRLVAWRAWRRLRRVQEETMRELHAETEPF